MTPTGLLGALTPTPAAPPFGGRPAYPSRRDPATWRLCRRAYPRAGWEDDGSGVPPRCYVCGRSLTPTARRILVGTAAGVNGSMYAYVRAWKHLPIRRRRPIVIGSRAVGR